MSFVISLAFSINGASQLGSKQTKVLEHILLIHTISYYIPKSGNEIESELCMNICFHCIVYNSKIAK